MLGDGEELLLHAERDLHRPPREERQHRDQRLQLYVELGAKSAAHERHANAHPVLRPAEKPRDLDAHEGRALRRRMDGEMVLGTFRHRDDRLERRVHHLLRAEAVLEHPLRRGHRLRRIAVPQAKVERHIRVLHALQVLEIRERPGGLQGLVHDRLGGHRLHLVVHRRQLLVFGGDEMHGLLRHVRIGGEHHRDRLADMAHLVDCEHRLIVERRAVVRLRHHRLHFCARDDAMHAGNSARGAHIDALDASVRHRRAEDLAVEHARQPQVVDVLGAAGDLEPGLEARHRAADLVRLSGVRRALHGSLSSGTRRPSASYMRRSRAGRPRSPPRARPLPPAPAEHR